MARDQVLYKQDDDAAERAYIVLVGSIDLKGMVGPDEQNFVSFGACQNGDTLGEEGVFENGQVVRKETSIAEVESYVLEISKSSFGLMQKKLAESGFSMDWFTLTNFMKKEWIKKRSWRMKKDLEFKKINIF